MYLIFDTETTGLPKRYDAPLSDSDNWPRCIQIAWQLHDAMGNVIEHQDFLVKPDGFNIPYDSEQIHGISTALAEEQGVPLAEVATAFQKALEKTTFVVGQNVDFDVNIMGAEFYRLSQPNPLEELPVLDTCTETTAELCKIPGGRGENSSCLHLQNYMSFYLVSPLQKLIMLLPMWKPLRVVSLSWYADVFLLRKR